MASFDYDVLVIGGGPAGYVAAIRAGQLKLKTACVEKRQTLGGTCLNVGCIPSKALLNSTHYLEWAANHSQEIGVSIPQATADFTKMQQNKESVVNSLVSGIPTLLKRNGAEHIIGEATLLEPHKVRVAGKELTAKSIIIATGSEAVQLPFLPFDEKIILSSTGALSLKNIPKRLLVIGAGAIGLELASVYARLGSRVTIVEMLERIAPLMDAAVSRALQQSLTKQGLIFHLGARVLSGKVLGNEAEIVYQTSGQETVTDRFDAVLVAIGRRPFTDGLGLEKLQVAKDQKGYVQVNNAFETNVEGIFAVGDVIGGPMLAHKAMEEGIAVANTLAGRAASIDYLAIPNVIYTHPEAASVGLTEKEAKDLQLETALGQVYFKGNPRARCVGETEGIVKVVGDKKSGAFLGLHIVGANASELIGEGVIALVKGASLLEIADASHAHPTLSEAIKEAALVALGRPLH